MGQALARFVSASAIAAVLTSAALFAPVSVHAGSVAEDGKKVAFDRKKGNCLACHMIEGGTLPGNIGPPLLAMKARFPDKSALRAQIWDATVKNPNSMMPPFGRNRVLSEEEIDKIVEFIYSL